MYEPKRVIQYMLMSLIVKPLSLSSMRHLRQDIMLCIFKQVQLLAIFTIYLVSIIFILYFHEIGAILLNQ